MSNYIKCPDCKNILDLSFIDKCCPNPLCGFNFVGLDVYLNKNDYELNELLISSRKTPDSREYKMVVTAIKYNMGEYLAHFIECTWGAHYNTLFRNFICTFLDDLNTLKTVLKSDVIKENSNMVVSKNGYKMFWELYCHLHQAASSVNSSDIRNFLKSEFPDFHLRHYTKWFLKYEKFKKDKRSGLNPKATLS
jgi:hypothetical protein